MKPAEWDLLDYKMKTAGKYLDEVTCWVYASEKGISIFAVYGIGDGTDNTPLYASGGKQAMADGEKFKTFLEGVNRGTYKEGTAFDRWLDGLRRE